MKRVWFLTPKILLSGILQESISDIFWGNDNKKYRLFVQTMNKLLLP